MKWLIVGPCGLYHVQDHASFESGREVVDRRGDPAGRGPFIAHADYTDCDMKTIEFDYALPPELIAQAPAPQRDAARMMIVHRARGIFEHRQVSDLPDYLRAHDLLVLNNTRVIPSRLFGVRVKTGGKVELLLLEERTPGIWEALYHTARPPRIGDRFDMAGGRLPAEVIELGTAGRITVRFKAGAAVKDLLEEVGVTPLPPYIKRPRTAHGNADDKERYQTVYAAAPGAVAAPTAGLHFTPDLFAQLAQRGVERAMVTLHVGPGTFKPVSVDTIEEHRVDAERYEVTAAAAGLINAARPAGGRIVAVGTTSVRTLETLADERGTITAGTGRSALFLYPPYHFKAVDLLLTNFHLPRSSLLMLVSAFAGIELVRRAYAEAIAMRYRFYSYGDCMLIAP